MTPLFRSFPTEGHIDKSNSMIGQELFITQVKEPGSNNFQMYMKATIQLVTNCKTTHKYTEHLYKHALSGNTYSDIGLSGVITIINKILLSKKFISYMKALRHVAAFLELSPESNWFTFPLKIKKL